MSEKKNEFRELIVCTALQLKNKNMDISEKLIHEAFMINPDAPEPHNLLGILHEMKNEEELACKNYRAACALDPSYMPASRNLERLVMYNWGNSDRVFDYGETDNKPNHSEKMLYISSLFHNQKASK